MINYRYTIVEKLGEGGSGEVFLVEDVLKKNRKVAIKVLHSPEKVGVEAGEAFQNEVSVLMNLAHPNLVRIFDVGVVRHARFESLLHRRFFTMEYVDGRDALGWISSDTTRPSADKTAVLEQLLLQALSVLAYIHHEGIIHFDIKPQNLVLLEDQDVSEAPVLKLMDFGFSRRREAATNVSARGTIEYTAPEILKAEAFDHRIDLYSLGATFYHLLEGHCPFEAPEPVEVIKRVLNDTVVFSPQVEQQSARLSAIIRRLMRRNPEERFRTAEEAARALADSMANGAEILDTYFGIARKPAFVGREQECRTIEDAIGSLTHPKPSASYSAIVVSGIEGIGKTTQLSHATKYARAHQVPVYELEQVHGDVPFSAIATMLPLLVADVRSSSEAGEKVASKFSALLGFDRSGELRYETWGQKRESITELLSRFLVECAHVFPYVIVVDNLHLIEAASVDVLRTAVRDVPAGRMLVLAASHPDQPIGFADARSLTMELRELATEHVVKMSASVFGEGDVARGIGAMLYQQFGGTPAIIVEALNVATGVAPAVAAPEEAEPASYLRRIESQLPKNLDEFLLSRFRKLNRERQLLLNVLACFQYPVASEILFHLLPFHRQRSMDHIRFLQLAGFIGMGDQDRLLFIRMKRLKETIYASVGAERKDLHAEIASVIERHRPDHGFIELQELAFQYSSAEMPEKALDSLEQAAEAGVGLFAFHRALQLFREALEVARQLGDDKRFVRLRARYTNALFKAGSYKETIETGNELLTLERLDQTQTMALFKLMGLSYSRLGEKESAERFLTPLLEFSSDEVERIEVRQELVGLQVSAGNFKRAEQECREQLERATRLRNDRLIAAISTNLGIATFYQDEFDTAVEYFKEALNKYEILNEKTAVINSINNIGNALSAKGDLAKAVECWQKALAASQDFGTLNQQAQILNNLGIAHYLLKQYEKAKASYGEARAIYERVNSTVGLALSFTNLGEVMFAEGEYESALRSWERAKALYASMDNAQALTEICLHIANVASRLGDVALMTQHVDEAEALIRQNNLDTFRPRCLHLKGVCHQLTGDCAEAEKSFAAVIELQRADQGNELVFATKVRLAECFLRRERIPEAVDMLEQVRTAPEAKRFPHILAETDYLLGIIASHKAEAVHERAIIYLKRGIETIAKEPVTETTWKLAYALAREYYTRGQQERAREYLLKARVVLQFFLSHFRSDELKRQYIEVDQKEKVLATIDSITKS
jgi:serine/threonine protein kinase/tetratricopeptide (TPR) repeat protein